MRVVNSKKRQPNDFANSESKNPKEEKWFLDRIGKKIIAKSNNAYNGEMYINNEKHASYLFHFSQNTQGYEFTDVIQPIEQ